uniref:G-protein coupled receptors family 1 profile domain-containing protein n=1 Tax=Plectus sambesii TaxID=2011161 RepID=A0A914WJM3_9BILA
MEEPDVHPCELENETLAVLGRCRPISISSQVPLDFALPLYGYVMPIIVAITVATNSFIVIVLSHKYLRTPTNYVLLAMAVTELLTGLSGVPWLLYYYTLQGYKTEEQMGLPAFWCATFPYMISILPSMFHTAAIWLTVYLAVQRYIYICMPKLVRKHCTFRRTKQTIMFICLAAIWSYVPDALATYNKSVRAHENATWANNDHGRMRFCVRIRSGWLESIGDNIYYNVVYGLHMLFVHTLPCVLLVVFTYKLVLALRVADRRHKLLMSGNGAHQVHVKRSLSQPASVVLNGARSSVSDTGGNLSLPPEGASRRNRSESAQSEASRRMASLKQNTRMLIAIIAIFLLTEIPAALIFGLHVWAVSLRVQWILPHYHVINRLLLVRNLMIVVSYPFRFAIYCGMSQQFRQTVKQLFSRRVLFVSRPESATEEVNGQTILRLPRPFPSSSDTLEDRSSGRRYTMVLVSVSRVHTSQSEQSALVTRPLISPSSPVAGRSRAPSTVDNPRDPVDSTPL